LAEVVSEGRKATLPENADMKIIFINAVVAGRIKDALMTYWLKTLSAAVSQIWSASVILFCRQKFAEL
jgi:hypothetical protein